MKKVFIMLFCSFLISSCTTISYTPQISLDVSPKTIQKSVVIEKFENVSPMSDTRTPFLGLSVTDEDALSGDLAAEVTNAIVNDFSVNALFKQVGRRIDNPDLIIRGSIRKFAGSSGLNTFGKLTTIIGGISIAGSIANPNEPIFSYGALPMVLWYFGIPIYENEAEIEIVLQFFDKNNNFISSYGAREAMNYHFNIYQDYHTAAAALTNKVFSKVMQNIRDQIVIDKNLQ